MKIQVRVNIPFGEITIDADTPKEILETLPSFSTIRFIRTIKGRLKGY